MIFLLIKGREEYKIRGRISLDKSNQCAFRVHSECIQSAFKNSVWLTFRFEVVQVGLILITLKTLLIKEKALKLAYSKSINLRERNQEGNRDWAKIFYYFPVLN